MWQSVIKKFSGAVCTLAIDNPACPDAATDNRPPRQCWVERRTETSPAGTAENPPTQLFAAASTARLVNTRIISRRYSGVSAEVVNGLAVFAARSPTASARFVST